MKMNWRDLFYFSKGERRALILLLCLVAIAAILLISNETTKNEGVVADTQYIVDPGNAPIPFRVDSTKETAISNTKEKKASPGYRKKDVYMKKRDSAFSRTEKFPAGTIVELNTADTLTLKKIPGIGSGYSRRIVKYRNLLGGFYSVAQLREVYGIEEELYQSLCNWFHVDTAFIAKLPVNYLPQDSLAKHPYINYKQAKAIIIIRKQKGRLSGWENLQLLEEFTGTDEERLRAYLAF